ncbi:hypothetical protein [Metamycoplasma auris]|uniref:Uncharacterized protein n=1 Tax=Metamycoplasma auris TaxID=51363 RepID=A0A2W7FWU6_9BACT|nr:hypothetical protein [Metamycoplasma auris]PZV98751.1 hypothetical protein BCF89_1105 [Metamycoplasma auris]
MDKKTKNYIFVDEIDKLLGMSYFYLISYLKQKYGKIRESYAKISSCWEQVTINNKINKENEGLYIHHVKEYHIPNLNTNSNILLYPEYQEARNLVYCNLIEYLILFIKIKNETTTKVDKMYKIIIPKLNDIYSGIDYNNTKDEKIAKIVKPLKNQYFKCLAYLELKKKEDFDKILTSLRENRKLGWSIKNNEDFFMELKKVLNYDKRSGIQQTDIVPNGPLHFIKNVKRYKEALQRQDRSIKSIGIKRARVWGYIVSVIIAIIIVAIIIVIAVLVEKKTK